MQITIDPEVIQKALNEQTVKATQSAFQSYAIESAIKEKLANVVVGDFLTTAFLKAVESIDVNQLAQAMAEQIAKTAVSTTASILEDNAANTIAKLRGYESFQNDYKQNMDKLRAEIRAKINKPS